MLLLTMLLAACSGPRLPFEKEQPLSGDQTALVRPPWEAWVRAGPEADRELDLETLNGPSAQPPPPAIAAVAPGPPNENLPTIAEQRPPISKPDKKGTVIRAVAVPLVAGAPGPGNRELTQSMRQVLREAGWKVVTVSGPDAISIRGKVSVGNAKGGMQAVKLSWVVTAPNGKVLGTISQANGVVAGSLAAGWGENARFATEAAAQGIFKLIQTYR